MHELPDPHQDLYFQSSNNLADFPLFNKLPPETRLQIWWETFPAPRRLDLCEENPSHMKIFGRQYFKDRKDAGLIRYNKSETIKYNTPAALFVNRESRTETLKHFIIVPVRRHKISIMEKGFISVRMPIYYQFEVDSVWFDPTVKILG